ncbi:hypothetical protein M0R45_032537 [Rubus argutus]|uniref:Uncharacterized protein n=1 Tax=Rubus argutus TaxID=59490 RepID=A0AAW1WJN6_RUBAR
MAGIAKGYRSSPENIPIKSFLSSISQEHFCSDEERNCSRECLPLFLATAAKHGVDNLLTMPPPPIDSKPNQSIHQAKPETPSANSLGKSGLPATTIRARGKSGFSAGVEALKTALEGSPPNTRDERCKSANWIMVCIELLWL